MEIKRETTEEIVKITVTKEAGEHLNECLDQVNAGFDGGKINRQDIASWIICKFKKSFGESQIQQIRKEFFKEKALLESIVKKAKATGDVPEFLREALLKHWNGSVDSVKRSAKKSQEGVENGKNNL